jgi:hypothetical protein
MNAVVRIRVKDFDPAIFLFILRYQLCDEYQYNVTKDKICIQRVILEKMLQKAYEACGCIFRIRGN